MDVKSENEKRNSILDTHYDPLTGKGSLIDRKLYTIYTSTDKLQFYVPVKLYNIVGNTDGMKISSLGISENIFLNALYNLRLDWDFEFWAALCVKIKPKEGGDFTPFYLNYPQRLVLKELISDFYEEKPIRLILLKARQWGGSTLIQVFMAWIQIRHKMNWHSLIAAHIKQAASNIRYTLSNIVKLYPKDINKLTLTSFELTQNIKIIKERNNKITIGSAETPDSIRSDDIALAHLSEVGLWKETEGKSPQDLCQSILGTIPEKPFTMYVMESTAKGVGNYFHDNWLSAKNGESLMKPVFISWFQIGAYRKELEEKPESFFDTLNDYELSLWEKGATLEGINWYRLKLKSFEGNHLAMMEEFPSDDMEAFQSSGHRVFLQSDIKKLQETCTTPDFVGELRGDNQSGITALDNITFDKYETGKLMVWVPPDEDNNYLDRYLVILDIGGRWKKADFSVITVIDRYPIIDGGYPEIVAEWRGHLDADLVVWKAIQIGKWYDWALFIPEVNTMRGKSEYFNEPNRFYTVMNEIVEVYPNIYLREHKVEKLQKNIQNTYGWHTNIYTKPLIIDNLIKSVREGLYIERNLLATYELDTYEQKPTGAYGAVYGKKDDLVMTRAIGLYVSQKMEKPKIKNSNITIKKKPINYASI